MFKLVKSEEMNKRVSKRELYENDYYILEIVYYDSNYVNYRVFKKENNKYIPSIYIDTDINSNIINSIKCETTSYGSVDTDILELIIEGLQIGKNSIEELKELLNEQIQNN